ncbi:MAG: hypothetical protein RML57_04615 [Acidobacteriota bacterium]|nr:hypothetical protein [Acidobacteriota bacterium]
MNDVNADAHPGGSGLRRATGAGGAPALGSKRTVLPVILVVLVGGLTVGCGIVASQSAPPVDAVPRQKRPRGGKNTLETMLVGVWQASPSMGAGWNDAYQFFSDGRFCFHTSQMNCAARERRREGSWRLDGTELILQTVEREVIVGGREVPATGSCASETEIVDGELRVESLFVPIETRLKVEAQPPDEETGRRRVKLDGRMFWKYDDDPTAYP